MCAMTARRHAAPRPTELPEHVERLRVRLADGAETTVHVARYDARRTSVRVVRLARPEPLEAWCRERGIAEALIGGFFVRPDGLPLGELRTRGLVRASTPFTAPFDAVRACVHAHRGRVTIAPRDELPAAPRGRPAAGRPAARARGPPGHRGGGGSRGLRR